MLIQWLHFIVQAIITDSISFTASNVILGHKLLLRDKVVVEEAYAEPY